jgi:hypothetical protein
MVEEILLKLVEDDQDVDVENSCPAVQSLGQPG